MRTLLECHYDDVHLQRWRQKHADDQKKAPERKGKHKVFASVVQTNRKRLYEALELPTAVKSILRSPEDETSWAKMKSLRGAICRVVEGEQEVFVESAAEREAIAAAIEAGKPKPFDDEVVQIASCSLLELVFYWTNHRVPVARRRAADTLPTSFVT